MSSDKSRTQDKIFSDMHRELRAWNREIPESPDRMDPILKILMRLYSSQLATIDKKIEQVWQNAGNSLIRALCPESKRWPVPAHTVMRIDPSDPVVNIDTRTRFFYKEERDNGQTFFFSPLRDERVISASIKYLFFVSGDSAIDLSPAPIDSTSTHSRFQTTMPPGQTAEIYLAVTHDGPASDFTGGTVFLKGNKEAINQIRWAKWQPGSGSDRFLSDRSFCPGLEGTIEDLFHNEKGGIDWGGLRKSGDLLGELNDNFILLPEKFTSGWEPGQLSSSLIDVLSKNRIAQPEYNKNLYWIKIALPSGGDKKTLQTPFEIYFNCFVVVNKNELTLFKHTGGNQLVEIEIPEDINNILDIISVTDSNGRPYYPQHEVFNDRSQKFYTLEERGKRLILWFDYSEGIEFPPDSITINYTVTSGTDANGIEAGKISDLYEHHPGIMSARNIIPILGAIPAKSEEQIVNEVSSRLRNRDRALSFPEISNWAMTYDPRIRKATCQNGVEKTDNGIRRCVIAEITIQYDQFYSEDEVRLLRVRLRNFLKDRAPINSQFRIEVIKA